MSIRLTPAEFAATKDKVAKINARAAKRGLSGSFEITGERVEVKGKDLLGFDHVEVFYETEITGEAPSYGGWTFLARVDVLHTPKGVTFTLATAPGVERIDRSLVTPEHCDHCNTDRRRNATYLVRNVETGEVQNVGSTCIKDFLGWDKPFTFYSVDSVEKDIEDNVRGHYADRTYGLDYVLALGYAISRVFGFVSASSWTGVPTSQRVREILAHVKPHANEAHLYTQVRGYAEEATAKVEEIKAFIGSDALGNSTYADNLKAVLEAGYVDPKQIGLVASAPQAYVRHLEVQAEREAREARWAAEKAAKQTSEYLGEPGDKIVFTGTIEAIRYIPGNYGTTTLYTFVTPEGNLVKWFSSAGLSRTVTREISSHYLNYKGEKVERPADERIVSEDVPVEEGDTVTLKATIKKHDTYEGVKSTVVTRCKEVV